MSVIATCIGNRREDFPPLDLDDVLDDSTDTLPKASGWNSVVHSSACTLVISGSSDNLVHLVRVRGIVYELVGNLMEEVRVSGVRCPIHSLRRVGKVGNKTIMDLVFATDPTSLVKEGGEGVVATCSVEFPAGFSPICMVSDKCDIQYLCATFSSIGLVAVDVSPISFVLLWSSPEECDVKISKNVDGTSQVLTKQVGKLEVSNVEPGTDYNILVSSNSTKDENVVSVSTPALSVNTMRQFYRSKRSSSGVYDMTGVGASYLSYLRKESILRSGDRVAVKGEWKDSSRVFPTRVVHSGETVACIDKEDSTLYVIPDFETNDSQYICIETAGCSHVVNFDRSETYVKYQDEVYPHNSSFNVGNCTVSVAKGSIILVVAPGQPFLFPGGIVAAEQVASSGDLVVKDVIMRSSSHVTEKVAGDSTYTLTSFYIFDSSDNSTMECSRISHGINDTKDSGSVSFNVLRTSANQARTVVKALETTSTSTIFTSTLDDSVLNTTIDSEGLSFDSDTGDIYFGSGKEFRIHFQGEDGLDPSMLQIQRLSATTAEYETSFLVTAEPP